MKEKISTCGKCILNDQIKGFEIDNEGLCNVCREHKLFVPYGEGKLIRQLRKAQEKDRIYDALVPLSGGKDSTYVLYLAAMKYKLNVLTYTFDNGFMSDFAKRNIAQSVKICGVDHIWVKHDEALIRELYRTALTQSAEICGICGIGIERSMLRISETWKIPLILLGHSKTEANSFTSENIYDQSRIKAILKTNSNISSNKIKRYLIYSHLNFITSYLFTKTGRFGKKVNILYYLDNPTEKEIARILVREMGWKEPGASEYTRHFDCIAEPFTNYIREKRFGNSRRLPQLSNMIRDNEISRQEAIKINLDDLKNPVPENYYEVLTALDLTEKDIAEIVKIPENVFGDKISFSNQLFAHVRNLVKGNDH
ncbi:MAG: hypothetical protein V1775_02440 [Bacteroidota bacterium]